MREIEFRAKRKDNGHWTFGDLYQKGFESQIYSTDGESDYSDIIIPATIGQYTGLTDRHEKKVYDGDIVRVREYENVGYDLFSYQELLQLPLWDFKGKMRDEYVVAVTWGEGEFRLDADNCVVPLALFFADQRLCSTINEIEVIGNIFDNPGLLTE